MSEDKKNEEKPKSRLKSYFKEPKESVKQPDAPVNLESLTNGLRVNMGFEPLSKAVSPQVVKKDIEGKYDKSKIVMSSREWSQTSDNIWQKGWQRISDAEQRQIAQLDPYIAAIIATRVSQAAAVAYESESKFDKGCRISDLNPPDKDDYDNDEEYFAVVKRRTAQTKSILRWMKVCGTGDSDILNAVFAGCDLDFKQCSLRQYLESQVRNLLTFGRYTTQIFRNDEGLPVLFRPVATETIYNVVPGSDVHIGKGRDTVDASITDAEEFNAIAPEEKPLAYVQRIDGQNVNFYTEDQLLVGTWQKQALFNLNGYPLSPIESAIFMVFVHQQTLSYLRNQFVKGMMAKGLLALESTNPAVELSEADLEDFRMQFHNYATRNDNSAVMPVLSGPVKANYIQLSQSPRDMEFLQIEEHIIRALCSAFQISPQEMGYGHLSLPQGGLSQSNKQEEIVRGEERGLRQLLDIAFDGLNEILYMNFPDARENFRLTYVGVGEDTRDVVIQRSASELQTTATMDSLFADSEKKETVPFGGKVPLAQAFHQNVVRYMKFGEFREKFMGETDASKNPAYDFIVDPQLNQAYQQLRVQPIAEQRQQAEMQNSMMQQQMEAQQQQMQQGGQPQPGGQEGGAPPSSGQPGGEQPTQEQPPEQQPAQKSQELGKSEDEEASVPVRDMWLSAQGLKKSMHGKYFSAWLEAHYDKIDE